MRLTFKPFDGRFRGWHDVVDEDANGERIGSIYCGGVGFVGAGRSGSGGIEVRLFGDRYEGTFNTYDQCCGFIKGVEAVLSHMTSLREIIPADAVSRAA
jgi:hypothetical protein